MIFTIIPTLYKNMQKLFSASIYGISGHLVEVEVDVVTGM